jgi:hypothetical protein
MHSDPQDIAFPPEMDHRRKLLRLERFAFNRFHILRL